MADTAEPNNDARLQEMRQWLDKAHQGDRVSLEWLLLSCSAIIRDRAEFLLAKKFRFLGNRGHDPDSIVSDVWLKLKRHFQQKLPASLEHLLAILALSVHHMLLDKVSAHRRRDRATEPIQPDGAQGFAPDSAGDTNDPQSLAEFTEFQEKLWKNLEELPEDQRRVFEMHYFLGITQARIAEDLELHPRQVSRLWVKASSAAIAGLNAE